MKTTEQRKTILIQAIEAAKASPESKAKLITQTQEQQEITESTFFQAIKEIPQILRNNDKMNRIKNKLSKDIIKLERHAYAPEMNKAHFKNGRTISTPQAQTIAQAVTIAAREQYNKTLQNA